MGVIHSKYCSHQNILLTHQISTGHSFVCVCAMVDIWGAHIGLYNKPSQCSVRGCLWPLTPYYCPPPPTWSPTVHVCMYTITHSDHKQFWSCTLTHTYDSVGPRKTHICPMLKGKDILYCYHPQLVSSNTPVCFIAPPHTTLYYKKIIYKNQTTTRLVCNFLLILFYSCHIVWNQFSKLITSIT